LPEHLGDHLGTIVGSNVSGRPFEQHGVSQGLGTPIGVLNFVNPEPLWTMLREGLRDLGYREGQNLQFEFRSAEGSTTRLPGLAAELLHLKVDAIIPCAPSDFCTSVRHHQVGDCLAG
jgi:putative ABC transport system substrate-binding protein